MSANEFSIVIQFYVWRVWPLRVWLIGARAESEWCPTWRLVRA